MSETAVNDKKSPTDSWPPPRDTLGSWYRVALGCAFVSGVLLVIVCGLLVLNRAGREPYNPLDTAAFVELKRELAETPGDAELKARLREMDLELRREHFRKLEFSEYGAYLVLGSLLVFLLSMKWVFACRRALPMPGLEDEERPPFPARAAGRTVAVLGILMGCAGLILAWTAEPGLLRDHVAAQASGGAEEPDEATSRPEKETFPTLEEMAKHWPRFRGAGGAGIAPFDSAPVSVEPESGNGILWKVKVPLSAPNSPVAWGDRVFLTGATAMKREVYCFDGKSGKLLWQEPVPSRLREPPEVMEDSTGFAAPTAAVDGKRVFAIFATGDLACFDFQGKRLWMKSYGPLENHYGHASSLLVYRHLLLVLMDQALEDDGKSVLVALDVLSGDVAWEAKRAVDASWITPIVAPTPQGDQVITNASPWVIAHDPLTGAEIWKADCMAGEVAPSPVYADGLVFCVNIDADLVAIRPDGKGDVTDTHIAWYGEDNLPDICSPLATDSFVFLLTSSGRLTCYDAKEGKLLWENKLKIMCNASPSLVGNHIYIFGTKGTFVVAEAAKEFKEVARSELGEAVFASPAFQDGRVYVRGQEHLYCLGTP